MREELNKASDEMDELRREAKALRKEKGRLEEEVSWKAEEVHKLTVSMESQYERIYKEVTQKVQQDKQRLSGIDDLQVQYNQLQAEFENVRLQSALDLEQTSELKRENEQLRRDVEQLRKQSERHSERQSYAEWKTKCESVMKEKQLLEGQLERLIAEKNESSRRYQNQLSDRDEDIRTLIAEVERKSEQSKQQYTLEIDRLKQQVLSLQQRQSTQVASEIEEYRRKYEHLQAEYTRTQRSQQSLAQKEEQVAVYFNQINSLEKDIMDMSAEIKKLKSDLDSRDRQLSQKENEISSLLREIDQLQIAKKKLTDQFQSQTTQNAARLSHKDANDLHELNLKLMQEIKALQQKISKLEKYVSELELQLNEANRLIELKNQQNDQLMQSSTNQKVIELEEQLRKRTRPSSKDRVSTTQYERKIAELERRIEEYQKETSFMKQIVNDDSMGRTRIHLEEENDDLKAKIIELENKCAMLAMENRRMQVLKDQILAEGRRYTNPTSHSFRSNR